MAYVYILTFPDGKMYIGSTRRSPEKRWQNGKGYSHQPKVFLAIQKYGWDNIKTNVLDGLDLNTAERLESFLIEHFNTVEDGYNYCGKGSTQKELRHFGNTVKSYRQARGLSQQDLAYAAGYTSKAMISQIESGQADIPYSKIVCLFDILGIPGSEINGY